MKKAEQEKKGRLAGRCAMPGDKTNSNFVVNNIVFRSGMVMYYTKCGQSEGRVNVDLAPNSCF